MNWPTIVASSKACVPHQEKTLGRKKWQSIDGKERSEKKRESGVRVYSQSAIVQETRMKVSD